MICNLIVHVIVSLSYWNTRWPLVLFFFFRYFFYFWKLSEKFWTAEFILFITAFFITPVVQDWSASTCKLITASPYFPRIPTRTTFQWESQIPVTSRVHFSKREVTNSSWEFILVYRKQGQNEEKAVGHKGEAAQEPVFTIIRNKGKRRRWQQQIPGNNIRIRE